MICQRCHSTADEKLNYCPVCGEKLRHHQDEHHGQAPVRTSRLWMYLLFLICVGAAGYGFMNLEQSYENISSIAQQQLGAIQNNRQGEAYYEYTSHDFQQSTSFENFKKFINDNPFLSKYKTVKFDTVDLNGNNAVLRGVIVDENNAIIPIKYTLIEEEGDWKVLNLEINEKPTITDDPNVLLAPIEKQLKALQNKDINKAYEMTSDGFKAATPQKEFQQFISQYPILTDNKSEIKEHLFYKGVGKVHAILYKGDKTYHIDYTLSKENGNWQIWGMQISDSAPLTLAAPTPAGDFDTNAIMKPIKDQLEEIKKGEYKKAYEIYTSNDFKKFTSQEQFSTFLKNYAVFSDNDSVTFADPTFDNNMAIITGKFTSNKGDLNEVEYNLNKEGNEWKIVAIRVFTSTPAETSKQPN